MNDDLTQTFLVTRDMQIKRYYFVLIRWTKIKKFDNNVIC